MNKCSDFLQASEGSTIPQGFKKIKLIVIEPIFIVLNTVSVQNRQNLGLYPLILIGEGSYGKVFKYKDKYYNKYFAIKRANKDLTDKEYERFKLEYEYMKKLQSPYVVEVYRFDYEKREYVMEYINETLFDYINKNNSKLTSQERRGLILQILRAFEYIHSKKILHRDISLTNILIKEYDRLNVIKISDFGLVKSENSNLTSTNTDIKGSLNDPGLITYGFKNYNITHEIYALTRVIYFVMTGKISINKFNNDKLKLFVYKGLNPNLKDRYQNISQLREAFNKLKV